jgi:hypothetical protein
MLVLTLAGFVGLLVLELNGCQYLINPSHPQPAQAYGWIMIPLMGVAFSLLGTVIVIYRPRNRIGWLTSLTGLLSVILMIGFNYGNCGLSGLVSLPYYVEVIWLQETAGSWLFLPFSMLAMLFPDGQFLSARWRRSAQLMLVVVLIEAILVSLWPGSLTILAASITNTSIDNPFGLDFLPATARQDLVQSGNIIGLLFFVLGIVSLVLRWRRAVVETRQQIKWLTFFLAAAGTIFVLVELIGVTIYPAIFDGWFYFLELAVFWLGLPLVIGLAVFKYRLYDIDIVIRRTLSYTVLTAILAFIYFSGVLVFQTVFRGLAGNPESPIIIVLSTLAIAALFGSLRLRVQTFIDRRFYRSKYDAAQALESFAQTARDEVEMERLTADLLRVVRETMQPEHATVWLKKSGSR